MRKTALILLLLCLLVSMAWAQDYEVTNAGTAVYNDTYTANGTYNSKPCYEGDVNGMWLFYAVTTAPDYDESWVLWTTKEDLPWPGQYAYWYGWAGHEALPPDGAYQTGVAGLPFADVVAVSGGAGGVADKITNRTNVRMVFTGCNPRMMF